MSDIAIRVEGLGKRYRRGIPSGNDRLSESLSNLGRALLNTPRRFWRTGKEARISAPPERSGEFWALKDLSFEVRRGEVVGIIGRNGAGKSTLLKILGRITEPTSGRFGLAGRVGSLLEVGTGFHPELTGRENVFLNGSLLGMSRREIVQKLAAITAFAEIDDFLDTPVKRYSSGMQVRLGFAVAAHLEPEILIVDEALAVGDAAFQKKCLGKIGEIAAGGRAILFVSHNLTAVRALCHRVVWLEAGRVQALTDAASAVARYLAGNDPHLSRHRSWQQAPDQLGNEHFRIQQACVRPAQGGPNDAISSEDAVCVDLDCEALAAPHRLTVTLLFSLSDGAIAFGSSLAEAPGLAPTLPAARCRCTCHIPARLLNAGELRVAVLVIRDGVDMVFRCDPLLVFEVIDGSERRLGWYGRRAGVVRPQLSWEIHPSEGKTP